MKRDGSRHRVALAVIGLTCAVAAPTVLAAGKPGDFKLAPTSPEAVSGDTKEFVVAAKLDDEPGTDLAIVNSFTSIALLSGEGDGDFTEIGTESVGGAPGQIAAADLDGENGIDLAVTSGILTEITILLNDGTGDFSAPGTSPETTNGGGITSADLDGDEDIDLATGSNPDPGTGTVLLNDGSGDFTAGDTFASPATFALESADLDDDDDIDVVALDRDADAALVSFNDGDGNLTDPDDYPVSGDIGTSRGGIAVGRIGGGRSPDIAVATDDGVELLLNDGDGGFLASPHSPLGNQRPFRGAHIGDVDRDGRGDVLAGEGLFEDDRSGLAVFLSRRGGRFKEPNTSPEEVHAAGGPTAPFLATGKFDRRKGFDIAAATPGFAHALSILLNRSP
jgi:FG-GAP-like repeat